MERRRLARFGLMVGLAGLFGCAPMPAPQVAVAPVPVAVPAPPPPPRVPVAVVAPAPIAVMPPPAPVAVMPPPPPPVMAAVPPAMHRHHWRRRYAALSYGPPCGSDAHPCSVVHRVLPIQ